MHSDTSLFLPHCYEKPLPIERRRERVLKDEIKAFDIRIEELSANNPTYCSNLACAKFIQQRNIRDNVGACIYCTQTTCTVCSSEEHHEELCPQDKDTILLKKEAERRKWRQCNNCRNLVELRSGCYHITYVVSTPLTDTHAKLDIDADANISSATCAEYSGRNVPVPSSLRLTFLITKTAPQPVLLVPAAAQVPNDNNGDGDGEIHRHYWGREYGPDCGSCGATYLPWVMRCEGAGCRRLRCVQCRIVDEGRNR
jgi:hypothetical protein